MPVVKNNNTTKNNTFQVTSNPPIQKKKIHPHYGNFQHVGHGFIAHAQ